MHCRPSHPFPLVVRRELLARLKEDVAGLIDAGEIILEDIGGPFVIADCSTRTAAMRVKLPFSASCITKEEERWIEAAGLARQNGIWVRIR